jgi:3-hydroxyisobutyrate dehydrogenase-like beta-hydroxyacid dehydrogenase
MDSIFMNEFHELSDSNHLNSRRRKRRDAIDQGGSFPIMSASNVTSVAFIGFGEVGQTFARALATRDDIRLSAYDILFPTPVGQPLLERAAAIGVRSENAPAAAIGDARFVVSAVTASSAEAVAREAARHLRPGQTFVDVNSAAPTTKRRAAAHIAASGADYIECAVMQPVLKPGLAVPILAGGPQAGEAAAVLNGFGMNLTPVATEFGRASAMKLCRSIMIKGLEALMVDCAAASEAQDVKDYVFGSLAETFPSIDWPALAENMRERVATHGVRRSAEMFEAGEMLSAIGMDPGLANAVAEAQLRGARRRDA